MLATFYVAGAIAVLATIMMLTRPNAVHALLYLIVSFLALAVVFFILGAPFVAALEVIIYAGAIMVLFVFVVMMLNLGERAVVMERRWLTPRGWIGPAVLSAVLLGEVIFLLAGSRPGRAAAQVVGPRDVGVALFGPYVIGVELVSLLLMGGIVGANHLGWRRVEKRESQNAFDTRESRAAAGGDAVRVGVARDPGAPEYPVHPDVR